jgi:2-keto-4-pentenoate hydratase/2-oxohepta-3-ene-1,7-dioic acid hydratase in catechol pathway
MKLAVVDVKGIAVLGLADPTAGTVHLIPESVVARGGEPLLAAFADQRAWRNLLKFSSQAPRPGQETLDLATTRLLAPLQPGKIVCLASNYPSHMAEARIIRNSAEPWLFMKPDSSVIGTGGTIVLPQPDAAVDWEVELCAVIGQRCRAVNPDEAMSYVAGFTIGNDVSLRSIDKMRETDRWDEFFTWLHGKWYDSFTPLGPWMVSRDEMLTQLPARLTLTVNGELKQDGLSSDMIFGVAESVAFISSITTLNPGDVVMTGTPSGVGAVTGTFLQPGDLVEATIQGIGTLRSHVRASTTGGSSK